MFNKIKLYQFDDYVFQNSEKNTDINITVTTQLTSTPLSDGNIRDNAFSRDRKNDYIVASQVFFSSNDDFLYLKKILLGEPKKIYFVSEDENSNIQFYFNYASLLNFNETYQQQEQFGQNERIIDIQFRLTSPFFYRIDDKNLIYYNFDNINTLLYDNNETFDSDIYYNQTEVSIRRYVTDLSEDQKKQFFGLKNCTPNTILNYTDNFFFKEESDYKFNYLLNTNFLESTWSDTNITINLNQDISYTKNLDATEIVINGVNPEIRQDDIVLPTSEWQITYYINIKEGNTGDSSHFILESDNSIDGIQSSPLTAITDGEKIGNTDYYRHRFSFTKSASSLNNDFIIKFKNSSGTDPSVSSNVYIKDPNVVIEDIGGVEYLFQPQLDEYINFINGQNSFIYTLTSNDQVSVVSNPLDLETGFENKNLILVFDQLTQNEFIEIKNASNNTGVRLTWRSINSSPDKIIMYLPQRILYDQTFKTISPFDDAFTLESINNGLLSFRPLRKRKSSISYNNLSNNNTDNLLIKKETSSNFNLMIKLLPTEN